MVNCIVIHMVYALQNQFMNIIWAAKIKITAKIPIQGSKKVNNYSADILVPTCSPLAARTRLSSCSNLQTTNGNL